MPITLICRICKQPFSVKPSHAATRRYCSRTCELADASRKRHGINSPCATCGKVIYVEPKALRRNKEGMYFCSQRCRDARYERNRPVETCTFCGKSFSRPPSAVLERGRMYCSIRCKQFHQQGPNHPRWRGGWDNYRGPAWRMQSKRARERDNHTCQHCGATGIYVAAHHIIPYRVTHDSSLENLITLCRSCHTKAEVQFWRDFDKHASIPPEQRGPLRTYILGDKADV